MLRFISFLIDKFSSSDNVFYFLCSELLGQEAKPAVWSQHEPVRRDELQSCLGPAGYLLHGLCNTRLHQHSHSPINNNFLHFLFNKIIIIIIMVMMWRWFRSYFSSGDGDDPQLYSQLVQILHEAQIVFPLSVLNGCLDRTSQSQPAVGCEASR